MVGDPWRLVARIRPLAGSRRRSCIEVGSFQPEQGERPMIRSIATVLGLNDIRRPALVLFLLALGAYAREPAREGSDAPRTSASDRAPERETHDIMGSYHDRRRAAEYPWYVITPPPGYILTPSGQLIFPDAPPPLGDTSTLSGAGPDVSTRPRLCPPPPPPTPPHPRPPLHYPPP